MLVSQFNFELPRNLIATSPARPRDSARLLAIGDALDDLSVDDITSFLRTGDVMVFNDTKVIPARLFGSMCQKQGGAGGRGSSISPAKIQVTLHKQDSPETWRAFAKPARKLHVGGIFNVADDFYAKIVTKNEGEVTLEFNVSSNELFIMLDKYGVPPLPPYIERVDKKPVRYDTEDYQTIYARHKGAVAAPTAGLHFTDNLLEAIDKKGVACAFVTLHVGAGTFLPMKVDNTEDHKMHSEYGVISQKTAEVINTARRKGGRVICVGTTSLRLLESAADEHGNVCPFAAETDIFITPGYKFQAVDMLLTNFHLPESTLFMLVCAFAGMDKMQAAYRHAIAQKYRFYSYGDACLLQRPISIL